MVMRVRYLIVIFALVLLINIAFAGFETGNPSHSIEGIYGPSDYIRGWVNISLEDEPGNSVFEDSRGNSADLEELLDANPGYTHSCNPLDCQTDYGSNNPETTKNFNLNSGESKIFGLKFSGNVVNINSISFDVTSNAPASCSSQLKIDFLDDNTIEAQNNKSSDNVCSPINYGCFDPGEAKVEFDVTGINYCQKMRVSEAPGLKIGAWVKKIGGDADLIMSLYDDIGEIDTCQLPNITGEGEYSCDINYLITEQKDYYICIYSPQGIGNYRIRGNSDLSVGCGFYDIPIPPEPHEGSYQIFAQRKEFDEIGILKISNTLLDGNSLNDLVEAYISDRYGSFDCSNGCIVPIRFISGVDNQDITIENLAVNYQKSTGVVTETNFYNLSDTPATINSEFQKLYLDQGNFSVPDSLGDYTFSLDLDGVNIFSKKVSVEDVPEIKFVKPTATASAFPTEFVVGVDSSSEIIKYVWDFGDNNKKTTSTNKTTHTYEFTESYNLKITVTDENGFSDSEVFEINVSSPKELINITLKKMRKNLDNIKIQIVNQISFTQKSLNSALKINLTENELERLEIEFENALLEEDYNEIISDLLKLEVPESILKTISSNFISFYPERENIDLDILQAISGGSYDEDKRGGYMDAILAWNLENLETKIAFTEFSAKDGLSIRPILKVFELRIKEIGDVGLDSNLIIRELDNLEFDKNYSEKEKSGYVYINLENLPITITFSTTEDTDFIDLPAFVSPPINKLAVRDEVTEYSEEEEKRSRLTIFILIILFLFIIGSITYVILQQWYKKKYEAYLFKNRTDLYNMVTYVNNAKKRGLKRKEIEEKLRKAGWSSEKVRYVMKKYAGKRTGMLEIPVGNVLDKLEKKRKF